MCKNILYPLFLLALSLASLNSFSKTAWDFTLTDVSGKKILLNKYKGSVLLVFNMATHCGYTPQLKGLQDLYAKYESQGLVVLGVPSNDFGGQAPEENFEILKFSQDKYQTKFPYYAKVSLKPDKEPDFFNYLISESKMGPVRWNFEKFLINRQGILIKRYRSQVTPNDPVLIATLENALKTAPNPIK